MKNTFPLSSVGPLQVTRTKPQEGMASEGTIVLFHGFGADAYDLLPLHQEIRLKRSCEWVFPNGPLRIPVAPGFEGRAWFPIDMAALEKAMQQGTHRSFSDKKPDGFEAALDKAHQTIEKLIEQQPSTGSLFLGGFSQGAMLALHLAPQLSRRPTGLVLLSGNLIDSGGLDASSWDHLQGVPFFQSHGDQDPVLSPNGAQELCELLQQKGLVGELISFRGGHEIPLQILRKLEEFLNQNGG